MNETHTLRNTIIGTVVGGILLSWLTGFLKIAWDNFLSKNISLPVWVLGIIIIVICTIIIYLIKKAPKKKIIQEKKPKNPDPLLTKILKSFSALETSYVMTASCLEKNFSISKIKSQYYIDKLQEEHLIEHTMDADNEEEGYNLTKEGRKFLVENNIIE